MRRLDYFLGEPERFNNFWKISVTSAIVIRPRHAVCYTRVAGRGFEAPPICGWAPVPRSGGRARSPRAPPPTVSQIDRQTPSSRTRSQPVPTHQALDRVQPALYPGSQQVVPHPPRAVGAIAVRKARSDLRAQNLVTARAGTRAPRQPRVEPTARDTERLAKESHRPDPPVLRNEPEHHIWSFAK